MNDDADFPVVELGDQPQIQTVAIDPVTQQEIVPPTEPTYTAADIERIKTEAAIAAKVDLLKEIPVPQRVEPVDQPAQPAAAPADPFVQAQQEAESNGILDSNWVTQRAIYLAQAQTEARVMAAVQPFIQEARSNSVTKQVAGDKDPEVQAWLSKYASAATNLTPELRELLEMAAAGKQAQVSSKLRVESTATQPTTIQVDARAYALHVQECKSLGISPSSKAEFANLMAS